MNPYVSFIYYINCWIVIAIMGSDPPLSLLQVLWRQWDHPGCSNLSLPKPGWTYLNDSQVLITYKVIAKLDKVQWWHCMRYYFIYKKSLSKILLLSKEQILNICILYDIIFGCVSRASSSAASSVLQSLQHNTRGSYDNWLLHWLLINSIQNLWKKITASLSNFN